MIKLLRSSRCRHLTSSISYVRAINNLQPRIGNAVVTFESRKLSGLTHSTFRRLETVSDGKNKIDVTELDKVTYERVCSETLDALCDYFEEVVENANNLNGSDISYSDGVLTVKLGIEHGTYVINRQSPNKQIWLSSPTSGPKRYDFVGPNTAEAGKWVYRHNGETLHELLQSELQKILQNQKIDFFALPYAQLGGN